MDLCFSHRAENLDHRYLDASGSMDSRIMLTCTIPLAEIVTDFFDKLKSKSSGFASFECVLFQNTPANVNANLRTAMRTAATKPVNFPR